MKKENLIVTIFLILCHLSLIIGGSCCYMRGSMGELEYWLWLIFINVFIGIEIGNFNKEK